MSVKKYFLAIVISEPLFQRIEGVKEELFLKHGLKGALRCPAHITLHRPFEWKEEKENGLIEKLKTFKFKNEFKIEFNNYSFFEPRVVYVDVIPNDNLFLLHNEIKLFAQKELRLYNEVNDLRGYHPHITVASRDLKKPVFFELQQEFKSKILSGDFTCNGFSLLKLEKKWEIMQTFNFIIP